MPDLEHALRELRVEWPETPDLASAVRARIAEQGAVAQRAPRRLLVPRPALAYLGALLVALVAVGAAVPSARSAILEFLGLKGAKIERREPDAPPRPTPTGSLGEGLELGRRVTLVQARRRVPFEVAPPQAGLPAPGAVYFDDAGDRVSFVYRAGPGLPKAEATGAGLLVTVQPAFVTPYVEKSAGAGTKIERLTIDGHPAVFLSGTPHGYAYGREPGFADFEDQRLAGNTLLVERGDLLIRVEGEIGRRRAVDIARAVTATSR